MANNEQMVVLARRQRILDFIKSKKSATRGDIQDFTLDVSKQTILRDLDFLVENGEVAKQGKTKSAVYVYAMSPLLATIDIEKYFAVDQDKRQLAHGGFNFDVWNNLHNLLTEQEKAAFATKNQQYLARRSEMSPAAIKKELERITIELSWKSSSIEGNTYTLLDTEELIKGGVEAKGKTPEEATMILNHKKALDFIFAEPFYFRELSVAKIENLHSLLIADLDVSKGIRKRRVAITGTNYSPLDNPFQIKEALEQLIAVINATENPLEKALIAVLMISYIQPFEDGNKRTARILGNALLLASNYCPLSYRSVDEVEYKKAVLLFYEQNNIYYFKHLFIDQFNQAVDKYF
ncbi:MAG: Fic family protein [Spirochaetaceae bacterium]|jgi:Fic family protein|nr:Fic family protein [Spirochaetaceae bacterium]